MTTIQEDLLRFHFHADDNATKYDDWSFYRNQFQNGCGTDNKAVDMICVTQTQTWLIEVKDYRWHARTKPSCISDEVAQKVRDTLACLVAAQLNANDPEEQRFAQSALRKSQWRVVLHLEQPPVQNRLWPQAINPAGVLAKLKRRLKAIDPHPIVMDRHSTRPLPWRVTSAGTASRH